jgi:hypothetical protein
MQKGVQVTHKKTGRKGMVHSLSKKHPGWLKVQWEGDHNLYRYEAHELEVVKCGREHSECPGYFCALPQGHAEVCLCN